MAQEKRPKESSAEKGSVYSFQNIAALGHSQRKKGEAAKGLGIKGLSLKEPGPPTAQKVITEWQSGNHGPGQSK